MINALTAADPSAPAPVAVFRRLFESQFVTLEGFAISCRAPEGMRYLDESVALSRILADEDLDDAFEPSDPSVHLMHRAMYEAWPEFEAVVSGPSLHLRALLVEGLPLPAPTSMMRKRGVTRLVDHLVEPGAMVGAHLNATLARARETATLNGMKHVLLVVSDGTVHVAAPSPEEAMAHYSNVEFSARVDCMRIEERVVHGIEG